ncbi:uncharacterized protein VTP21DRAFT_2159 [Calcarisporiella thermophila]|uniref:uncharacterized protein n=1 Tax=Calcarisporiella thermophila TaxID=911321 RepID=UPI0037440396
MLATTVFRKAPTLTRAFATQVSSVSNGVRVATSDDNLSGVSSLSLVVPAGSRYESAGNAGVAHFLKNFGFRNNAKRTAFRITRETELLGGQLTSSLGRENIVYTAQFLKDDLPYFAEILADIATSTKFNDWEVNDIALQVKEETEAAAQDPTLTVLNAAHQAAFRTGLGNSLYATGNVSPATLRSYAQQAFGGKLALIGAGIDHKTLTDLAETLFSNKAETGLSGSASKYYGGEVRISQLSEKAHYVLAFEGASLTSPEYAAAQVLQYALGGDSYIKGNTSGSPLAQVASKISPDVEVSAFHSSYSDAGLFGVYVRAPNSQSRAAVESVAQQIRAKLSEEDIKRGIAQAKFAAAQLPGSVNVLEQIGSKLLAGAQTLSTKDAIAQFDKVQAADVHKFAEKILKGKPTAVAYGDNQSLPYVDSL